MIGDALLDWLFTPFSWVLSLLPAASADAAAALGPDPGSTLHTLAASPLITGGVGVLINGGLFVAMLTSWITIEVAIQTVRGVVWIKKAVLF